jgi:hypothetical protein
MRLGYGAKEGAMGLTSRRSFLLVGASGAAALMPACALGPTPAAAPAPEAPTPLGRAAGGLPSAATEPEEAPGPIAPQQHHPA